MIAKLKIAAYAAGAILFWGGATAAYARDWDDWCARKIEHEQRELDRAIYRHGYYSRQADAERRELARLEERCRWRDRYR